MENNYFSDNAQLETLTPEEVENEKICRASWEIYIQHILTCHRTVSRYLEESGERQSVAPEWASASRKLDVKFDSYREFKSKGCALYFVEDFRDDEIEDPLLVGLVEGDFVWARDELHAEALLEEYIGWDEPYTTRAHLISAKVKGGPGESDQVICNPSKILDALGMPYELTEATDRGYDSGMFLTTRLPQARLSCFHRSWWNEELDDWECNDPTEDAILKTRIFPGDEEDEGTE